MIKRRSSCVNARGIPPATWQVLLLCYPIPSEGYPIPGQGGTPPLAGESPTWGIPNLTCPGGTPSLAGVGVTYPGVPSRKGHGTSHWGSPPRKDMGPIEVLWDRDGIPSPERTGPVEVLWDRDGVPARKEWDQWNYYGIEMGYPLCGQTHTCENSTFPSY